MDFQKMAKDMRKQYPPGTRVQLDHMGDDPNPIELGTKGTVKFVDDAGTVHTQFDNGRFLGMCPGEDSFHKITESECEPEITDEPTIRM